MHDKVFVFMQNVSETDTIYTGQHFNPDDETAVLYTEGMDKAILWHRGILVKADEEIRPKHFGRFEVVFK